MMAEHGMSPESFDDMNFYRLQEIMQARSADDRPEDAMEMLKRIGLAPGDV